MFEGVAYLNHDSGKVQLGRKCTNCSARIRGRSASGSTRSERPWRGATFSWPKPVAATFLFSAPFGSGPATLAKFQHNQLLEELRNLQDRLSKEKAEWTVQEEHISEQRKQLLKPQEQVRIENTDIQQYKENLYQKLEALRCQGISWSQYEDRFDGSMASAVSPTSGDEETEVTGAS